MAKAEALQNFNLFQSTASSTDRKNYDSHTFYNFGNMDWEQYGEKPFGLQQAGSSGQFQAYSSISYGAASGDGDTKLKVEEDFEDTSARGSNVYTADRKAGRSGGERRSRRVGLSRPAYSTDSGEDSKETKRRQNKKHADSDKPDPVTAAKNKASRERQRRERLNESFVELVKTIDPDKSPKAEKTTIISDTIKYIGNIRNETEQLRSENQNLEEELKNVEKEKHELMFQRRVMESQLHDLRIALYGNQQERMQQTVGQGEGMGMAMEMNRQAAGSPSPSGIARMFQSQATLQGGMQENMPQIQLPHTSQSMMPQQQQQAHANHNPGSMMASQVRGASGTSFPNTPDFLDLDLAMEMGDALDHVAHHADENAMSMSPVLWLGTGPFDPHADASYMSSNL